MASYVDDDEVLDMYESRVRELKVLERRMLDLFDAEDDQAKTVEIAQCTRCMARVSDSIAYLEEDLIDIFADGKPPCKN